MGGKGYSLAFDPLDGSSIIDSNFTVATIWGCWPGSTLVGVDGRSMTSAGVTLYGPRTTMTLAVSEAEHSHEFLLTEKGWERVNTYSVIGEGKLHAPGNLRAIKDNAGYAELVQYWQDNTYQLRYTGGMAPDVLQLLVKKKGIFTNPHSKSAPAKLRCLYETIPIAFIVEKAGGGSSDGEGSILDVKVTNLEQKMQVAYGNKKEVERFERMVGVKYV
ncbi:fructose-1,6-bisphosphatase [Sphaeroforma arctica JP610]|uniref:Fructose-1,6-bisphosphatase n=1 Tax=Sphaeroforma arctica JP610 TaxID=667725 RepID=A0A0L0GAN1_9EUKA|nr:fructose-1,6-bisphosphatase [Sphaeroforma arctica JP610]KNC86050.1 fructose-1,6-bisphosphatase [Sphaeroforma arctica JP610]|eukprot:XP_014159952.1 fructose-1,6-bisphosphatase [Sphaeroforma arctica JP610]